MGDGKDPEIVIPGAEREAPPQSGGEFIQQPAKLMRQAGFGLHVGRDNICPHITAALERAKAVYEKPAEIGGIESPVRPAARRERGQLRLEVGVHVPES